MIRTKKFENLPQITSISPSGKIVVTENGVDKVISFEDFSNLPPATEVWDNSSTTFTASEVNVTDIQSAADSKLLDLKVNTTSKFVVRKDGNLGIGVTNPAARLDISDTVLAGSGSLAGSALNLAQTWNTTGNPTAIKLNVTNTVSGTTSNLLDLQVNGTSKLRVNKDGLIIFPALYSPNKPYIGPFGSYGLIMFGEDLDIYASYSLRLNGNPQVTGFLQFGRDSNDLHPRLIKDADRIIGQRNGVNPQSFRIYNTYTSATNFERLNLSWDTNVLKIGTEKGSAGGTARAMELQTDGTTRMTVTSTGSVGIGTTAPADLLEVVGSIGKFSVTSEGYSTSMTRSNSNLRFAGFNIGIISFMGTADGYTTQQTGALINSITEGSGGETWQLRPSANLLFHTTPNSSGAALTERMRITGAGLVGIGTTNPTSALEIVGASGLTNLLNIKSVAQNIFSIVASGGSGSFALNQSNSPSLTINQSSGNKVVFQVGTNNLYASNASNAPMNLIIQGQGGNLGLGTSSPLAKLDIAETWNSNIAVTGASGTGSVATITFSTQSAAIPVGSTIVVASVNPAGYNGTFVVTASSVTSVSYANVTTTTYVSGGTVQELFTAVKLNVTDTASASNSLLMNLQVGGSSKFNVKKDGDISATGIASVRSVSFPQNNSIVVSRGIGCDSSNRVAIFESAVKRAMFYEGGVATGNQGGYDFCSGAQPEYYSVDLSLRRDASNTLAQRNGVNPQTFRIYNTYTDATTFERLNIKWDTNVLKIGTEKGTSGGTARAMDLQTDGTSRWTIDTSGRLIAQGHYGVFSMWQGGFHVTSGGTGTIARFYGDNGHTRISSTETSLCLEIPRLTFNGTTSSFPAIKRNGAGIQIRLADDSANTTLEAGNIYATGNVGIGTTSPGAPLHLQATAVTNTRESLLKCTLSDAGNDAFHVYNGTILDGRFTPSFAGSVFSGGGSAASLLFVGQTNAANDSGTTPLIIFQGRITDSQTDPNNGSFSIVNTRPLFSWLNLNTSLMQLNANGNLGIGTTTPLGKLDVNGNVLVNGATQIIDSGNVLSVKGSTSLSSKAGYIVMTSGDDLVTSYQGVVAGNHALPGAFFGSFTNSKVFIRTNNTERVTIDTSGNVGIGTTAPSSILDISDSTGSQKNVTLSLRNGSFGWWAITSSNSNSSGFLRFASNNSGQTPLTLDGSTGSVGISKNTPAAKLDIEDTTLAGSGSLAGSILNLAQTWNTTGAPTAIKLNVTNTASGAASNLLDLQVDTVSKFKVDKNGVITFGSTLRTIVSDGGGVTIGGVVKAQNYFSGQFVSGEHTKLIENNFVIGSSGKISFMNGPSYVAEEFKIQREGVGILGQQGGVNPQSFRLYNTYTDANTFERLNIKWDTNVLKLGTEKGGSGGTARDLVLETDGTERVRVLSTGNVGIGITNPLNLLHVQGSAIISNGVMPNYGSYAWSFGYHSGGPGVYGGAYASGIDRFITLRGSNAIKLKIANQFSQTIFCLDGDSGRLGLGNIAPLAKLDISDTWDSNIAVTGASGTGSVATITFDTQSAAIPVGSTIVVASVNPTGYNGTFVVTASSVTSVSYANATTTTYVSGGTVQQLFTAIKVNITDTNSASDSNLLDLKVGDASKFKVDKTGKVVSTSYVGAISSSFQKSAPAFRFSTGSFPSGLNWDGNGFDFVSGNGRFQRFTSSGIIVRDTAYFGFGASIEASGTDLTIYRDDANILAQRNGVNPQAFRLYNTYTDATTFERLNIKWDTNVLKIGTEKGGSGGTARAMEFQTDGATRMIIGTTNNIGVSFPWGNTTLSIAAGDSTYGTYLSDSVGGAIAILRGGSNFGIRSSNYIATDSGFFGWGNSSLNQATSIKNGLDTAFSRNASGIVEINNGTAGQYRDLILRNLTSTGSVSVSGHFSATTKSFLIPHPTKPDKKLQYACLEGPENGVYIRGKTNEPIILLPDYWSELVDADSITVTVTPIGKPQQLFVVSQNSTSVEIGNVDGLYNYLIFAERKDVNKLQTEI